MTGFRAGLPSLHAGSVPTPLSELDVLSIVHINKERPFTVNILKFLAYHNLCNLTQKCISFNNQ